MAEFVPRVSRAWSSTPGLVGIAMTVDAEEADRLEIVAARLRAGVSRRRNLAGYDGLGLAVQTYQRRATDVIRLSRIAGRRDVGRRIPGPVGEGCVLGYRDQACAGTGSLESYPVFTRKEHTDVSYLACARKALDGRRATVPAICYTQCAYAGEHHALCRLASQRLRVPAPARHGGRTLRRGHSPGDKFARPCRVYAPVGSHEDLLPYLVRRLLENGANTSFVNRIVDESVDVEDIVADPVAITREHECRPHSRIPAPAQLFGDERMNSAGVNVADDEPYCRAAVEVDGGRDRRSSQCWSDRIRQCVGRPVADAEPSNNPADIADMVGMCRLATPGQVDAAIEAATAASTGLGLGGGE